MPGTGLLGPLLPSPTGPRRSGPAGLDDHPGPRPRLPGKSATGPAALDPVGLGSHHQASPGPGHRENPAAPGLGTSLQAHRNRGLSASGGGAGLGLVAQGRTGVDLGLVEAVGLDSQEGPGPGSHLRPLHNRGLLASVALGAPGRDSRGRREEALGPGSRENRAAGPGPGTRPLQCPNRGLLAHRGRHDACAGGPMPELRCKQCGLATFSFHRVALCVTPWT